MNPRYLPLVDGLLVFILFVGIPLISLAVGIAAWKGKPSGLDRKKLGLSALIAGTAGSVLMVYTQRMAADVRSPLFFLQLVIFAISACLLGVAGGCVLSIFVYRRGEKPQ